MKPILFNTAMVQAILDGRKSQTRRIVKSKTGNFNVNFSHNGKFDSFEEVDDNGFSEDVRIKPKYQIGDVLWVRESFYKDNNESPWSKNSTHDTYTYKADNFHRDVKRPNVCYDNIDLCTEGWHDSEYPENPKWKASIHMPKEACRLFLKITNVRAERIQDITEEDAIAEGVEKHADYGTTGYIHYGEPDSAYSDIDAVWSFETLWQSINGKKEGKTWDDNPWVWVYDFEIIEKPEA